MVLIVETVKNVRIVMFVKIVVLVKMINFDKSVYTLYLTPETYLRLIPETQSMRR